MGSSLLQPISGACISSEDLLIVCPFDESFHIIYQVSLTLHERRQSVKSKASETARLTFRPTERELTDVNCIRGFIPYDENASLLWVRE